MKIEFITVKTDKFTPPKFDIYEQLDKFLPDLQENDVVFITSKVLAIHQGECIARDSILDKDDLIKKEADYYIERDLEQEHNVMLTIKDNIIIASAGIDESNSDNYYVLWPKEVDNLLKEIRSFLCNKYKVKNLAVISTDSHTTPLRLGVSGIATGLIGVEPLKDERGASDIFGRELKITRVDQITPMTSMAVWYMGEGGEQTPICIGRNIEGLVFNEKANTNDFFISPEEDIFKPMLKTFYEK